MSFVHLHVHSCYSLLDGAIKLDDLVNTAKSMDMPAVALTDHGQMFGIWPFKKAAQKAGIKAIYGVETYTTLNGRRSREASENRNHLILLAKNMQGYKNLCRLISIANVEGFYYRPRLDKEILQEYNEGLIALSGCLQGEIPQYLLNGNFEKALASAQEYGQIFKDRFYLELQENAILEQTAVNNGLIEIGQKLGLPLVATNDCHYLKKEHHDVHDVLLCIQTAKTVDEEKRMRFDTREFYFKSPEEMKNAFHYAPEAFKNTLEIAKMCNVEFPEKFSYAFPALKLKKEETAEKRLETLAKDGLEKRFLNRETLKPFTSEEKNEYKERLKEEVKLINQMGFPGYFLIVADFIGWAKKNDIPVGPGRGSAAGSLVAYALEITDVDPIRYGLLFERFLNPERVSMPDIDVDFCTDGRDEVIKYVTENYGGKTQVSQIITFGQMRAKAVIRDVGRALGIAYGEVDKIAKLVPNRVNISLAEALKEEPQILMAAKSDAKIAKLIEYAKLLENLPRHASTHAAGVVIGDKCLMEHLPLYCDANTEEDENGEKSAVITQFDMKGIEEIGLIKFDFLGLKTLTLIKHCLTILKEKNIHINLDHLNFEDEKTYKLLSAANTTGVFQLESSGMREILLKLRPSCIDDLMALVALYRPGPLKSGMVDIFINGKHGREKISYVLPSLEPILKETYGVILYQEQVMRISQVLANYSLGEADLLRRAMGKKQPEEMAKQKSRFMSGAKENKIDSKKADYIFELMANFAEYGFNKSHSAAYAIVAYQTAYLKANYPVEFMAALFSSEADNQDKVVRLIRESRAADILVLPPDVNESGKMFNVAGSAIHFGLGAVKGLGQAAIESIIEGRKDGKFENLFEFCEKVDTSKVNRRVIESLIKCGAFDKSGNVERSAMLAALDDALESGSRMQRDKRTGQSNMFDLLAEQDPTLELEIAWPSVPPWPENMRLANEKEALGFFVSGHPLEKYELELKALTNGTAENIKYKADRSKVQIAGIVSKVQIKLDKRGRRFAYLTLEDLTGSLELLVWANTFEEVENFLIDDNIILVSGTVDNGERAGQAAVKVIVNDVLDLSQALEEKVGALIFKISQNEINEEVINFFEKAIKEYPGTAKTFLNLNDGEGETVYKLNNKMRPCRQLIESAFQVLGQNSIDVHLNEKMRF